MDIAKLLNGGCKFIDADPCSDAEYGEDVVSSSVPSAGAGSGVVKKGKKGKKPKLVESKASSEDMSLAQIIEDKPSKKVIEKYIKMRIEQILDEDSD
jgi:hypothetical protein